MALGGDKNVTTYEEGWKFFKKKLSTKKPSDMDKEFFYINIWNTLCLPCVKEMPWLDSVAGQTEGSISFCFVSDNSDDVAKRCIERAHLNIKNFIYLNDMNDFISGVLNERNETEKIYPTELFIDNEGHLLYHSVGAHETPSGAAEFLNKLKALADTLN